MKIKPIKADLLLTVLSRLCFVLSIYGFYWILEYIGWAGVGAKPPVFSEYFFAMNLQYIVYFVVFFGLAVFLEMCARYPKLRQYFTHIERGRGQKMSDAAALARVLEKYPHIATILNNKAAAGQSPAAPTAQASTEETPSIEEAIAEVKQAEEKKKLPLI